MAIRIPRGEISQPAMQTGRNLMNVVRNTQPRNELGNVVSEIGQKFIQHKLQLEEQRISNKNTKNQGLLLDRVQKLNEKFTIDYANGDISDEEIMSFYQKEFENAKKDLLGNEYKDDPIAWKKFEGTFYSIFTQGREKTFALKANAIIAGAGEQYNNSNRMYFENLDIKNNSAEVYEKDYNDKVKSIKQLGAAGIRVDADKEINDWRLERFKNFMHNLVEAKENKDSAYWSQLGDEIEKADVIGGTKLSREEKEQLIEFVFNKEKLEFNKETIAKEKTINQRTTNIIERIDSDNPPDFDEIKFDPSLGAEGKEAERVLKQTLDDRLQGNTPGEKHSNNFPEIYERVYLPYWDPLSINSLTEKFTVEGELESEAKSLLERKITSINKNGDFGDEQWREFTPYLNTKRDRKIAREAEAFEKWAKDNEQLILGTLRAWNPMATTRYGEFVRFHRSIFEKELRDDPKQTAENLLRQGSKDYILTEESFNQFAADTPQQADEMATSILANKKQMDDVSRMLNLPKRRQYEGEPSPKAILEWVQKQGEKDPDFLLKSSDEKRKLYYQTEEYKQFINYPPYLRNYLNGLYKEFEESRKQGVDLNWDDYIEGVPKTNPIYIEFWEKKISNSHRKLQNELGKVFTGKNEKAKKEIIQKYLQEGEAYLNKMKNMK